MRRKINFAIVSAMFCILACGTSCVYINEELGSGFIPTEQRYEIHTTDFPISEIGMLPVDQLSGYSSTRITIGAVRDGENVSTRSSAFTLIPASEYDFGTGGEVVNFHLAMARDTLSFIDESQRRILQDINVFALETPIDESDGYISTELTLGERIADVATYDGSDSLSFDFRNEWAAGLLEKLQQMEESAYDSVGAFTHNVFPGICLTVDEPASNGGRINMFELTVGADLDDYSLKGGYALMTVKGVTYEGRSEPVDTSFLFLYGAQDFSITQEAQDYFSGATLTPQYALNMSSSTADSKAQEVASAEIIVDGGGGLKPVIRARGLRDAMISKLQEEGVNPQDVIINKATIVLPFRAADYDAMDIYPPVLSPSCRLVETGDEGEEVTYAGITDTSVSTENQGQINRSTFMYTPDISYHMQQILDLEEYDESDEDIVESYEEKDIWLLIMSEEAAEEEQEGMSEYAENLYYNMYYNNLYNNYYGYGGYGYGYGYGYGGYGYGNYYDYYTLAALYSMQGSQQSQESTTTVLDRDRYFSAVLNGPQATEGGVPYLKVTYSVKQNAE